MEQEKSISISVSKDSVFEEMSLASPAREPIAKTPDTISNEQICRGDDILGTYTVTSDAVSGGMGSVWCVRHRSWDTDLAMKRPQPRFFAEGSRAKKQEFVRECENWIHLGLHPNIVSCYYVREIGGVPTIFSEWMDNGSLRDRIHDGSLYEGTETQISERILDIAIQSARGLRYSQEQGLLHRDMKPGNLLLTKDWSAKVADFGLAKARAQLGCGEALSTGYTAEYCPKEQMEGAVPEAWMDVYAWALTVLEMYLGRRRWRTGAEAVAKFDSYPSECRIVIPEALVQLLRTCLTDKKGDFKSLQARLEAIYASAIGRPYPRTPDIGASDTADSLNNRALSFIDLGMPDKALELWNEALRQSPEHSDSIFNRQLCLMRFFDKYDYEAIRELKRHDPDGKLGMVEAIRKECGGTYLGYDEIRCREFRVSGSASSIAIHDGRIYFPVFEPDAKEKESLDPRDHSYSHLLGLKSVRLDDPNDCVFDPMDYIRPYLMQGRQEIKLFPAKGYAVYYQNAGLYLFDFNLKKKLAGPVAVPGGLYGLSLAFSPKGNYLALSYRNQPRQDGIAIIALPSLQILYNDEHMHFVGFDRSERALLRTEDRLFRFSFGEADERVRLCYFEVPLFEAYEFLGEDASFLCYRDRNGTAFRLDEDYEPVLMPSAALEKGSEIIHYDPANSLLYWLDRDSARILAWDLNKNAWLYTFSCHDQFYKYWDSKNRWLIYGSAILNDQTEWAITPLPERKPDTRSAMWRLSGIITSGQRIEEDLRLASYAQQFRQAAARQDIAAAIRIHRQSYEIEGFALSPESEEMEAWLETNAERCGVFGAFPVRKTDAFPDLAAELCTVHHCANGEFAMVEEGMMQIDGLVLFSGDGSRSRKIKIDGSGSGTRPYYVSTVVARGDRIYAVSPGLQIAVYDLDGQLLQYTSEAWPPETKSHSSVFYDYADMDSCGRHILFSRACDDADRRGFFEMDLKTFEERRISDKTYLACSYLKDDTIVIKYPGGMIARQTSGSGKTICTWNVDVKAAQNTRMRLNQARDRIIFAAIGDKGKESATFVYDMDGKLLQSWKAAEYSWLSFMDGRFLCEPNFRIRDSFTGELVFKAPIPTVTSGIRARPDGREVYVRAYDQTKREGAGEVTAYRIKYYYQEKTHSGREDLPMRPAEHFPLPKRDAEIIKPRVPDWYRELVRETGDVYPEVELGEITYDELYHDLLKKGYFGKPTKADEENRKPKWFKWFRK